ncbi:MAG: hypothetical protein DRO99_04620 [Candidatus Aenigmatarchaeota archaeon]|nr:MAG: hypothetical protein DRO99_04620 [Candidatus Aenigmarchaeota archaeon]
MSVIITGGAGFIGSHLAEKLVSDGFDVICIDNFNGDYDSSLKERNIAHLSGNRGFNLINSDLTDINGLMSCLAGMEADTVIHLAAKTNPVLSMRLPGEYVTHNVSSTANILDVSNNLGADRFIMASSSSVYGCSSLPSKEDDPTNPQSPYALSKLLCEILCKSHNVLHGTSMSILRLFTVYGPRQRPDMAIHKFVSLIERGLPVEVYGDGSSSRDYTYVDDAVHGIICAMKRRGFGIFNIGSGKRTNIMDMVSLIEKSAGKRAVIRKVPMKSGDIKHTIADIGKARKELGYSPKTCISEGVSEFVKWYRRDML